MSGALQLGSSLSHYRVISSLGAGGMGEVYKAHDTNLDRVVALKILPPELVRNDDRVRRFVQEAKSASSLNHPHIVTIHEIGQVTREGGEPPIHYIAMELVDGMTLRSKIHDEQAGLKSILLYMTQAADGLAKAHASGIIHRDLKPENIMVTRDGYAKVLDFGLAKLSIRKGVDGGTSAPTEARDATREGSVLGTVAYMSPEQVQGRVVDPRSDIFSFGCILYEAATRRRAFEADSDIDVMHKIVHDRPPAIDEINPNVPAELRRIIRRCLNKEPERRYQSMKDLAIELAEIVEEFDALSASVSSHSSGSVSISSPAVPALRRRTTWIVLAAVVVLFAVVAAVEWNRTRSAERGALRSMRLQKATSSGNVVYGAISPDGRYLAHVTRDENGDSTLFVRQVATASDVKLIGPTPNNISRPSFSPDGNYVYYGQYDRAGGLGFAAVFRIPALGGTPRKLLYDVDTMITFSPDGERIAFGRGAVTRAENDILIASVDGSGERVIARTKRANLIFAGPVEADWSPDGTRLATALSSAVGGPHDELTVIDIANGNRSVIGPRWMKIWSVTWRPDGRSLVISGVDKPDTLSQLWLQPFPEGEPERITNDLNSYGVVTVTRDGKTLAARQDNLRSRLFTAALGDEENLQPITPVMPDQGIGIIHATASGLVYPVNSGSGVDIWAVDPPAPPRQLTSDGVSTLPQATGDGATIFFTSRRAGGVPNVWKMDADGSNPAQVTRGKGEVLSAVSADGSARVVYDVTAGKSWLESPRGRRLIVTATTQAAFSPDGRWLAFDAWRGNSQMLTVIPVAGGNPVLDVPVASSFWDISWAPDGSGVTYSAVSGGAKNIWKQPLDGSAPQQLTRFKDAQWSRYAWMPAGQVAIVRPNRNSDIVLISDFSND